MTYSDPSATKVRVPLLAEALYLSNDTTSLTCLRTLRPELLNAFPVEFDALVHDGDSADASEDDVLAACSNLRREQVRRWSYPAVFYREVRSGYVHELNPTERASHFPASAGRRGAAVTYLNSVDRPFRRIHFDVEWLCRNIESMAVRAYPDWQRNGSRCAIKWWIDGA